ncbi:FG-GAP repeat domain-containing protein [Bremerella volcania]|uniref:FG-GAP repeat domain-containing protein n=1 Tax=Bremerella volcania TaxID=2527984 RepID=UPI0013FD0EC2|nr:VCBS repeat-containing protein [Bremerella volcania]
MLSLLGTLSADEPWKRHTIDNTSRGADGVRPQDVNGDGLPDLCTGWEEGSVIRAYLHPGHANVKKPWPAVTVGKVKSPEDAVFMDVNGDGTFDVVSSCEGKQQTVFVHLAPTNPEDYLRPNAWKTQPIAASENQSRWMFALPWQIEKGRDPELIAGSKAPNGAVGIFRQDVAATWSWHKLTDAGWIMSLVSEDINQDGQADLLFSDRKGKQRGVYWIDLSREKRSQTPNLIGGAGHEVMFLDAADLDQDGHRDVVCTTYGDTILWLRRTGSDPVFEQIEILMPANTGTGKSVRVADVNLDGQNNLVISCGNSGKKHGVMWMQKREGEWIAHTISGTEEGIKFDLLQLIDLDGDGDLDVLTCEERDNLGVIWYENPTR